jgi:hypothetical protein
MASLGGLGGSEELDISRMSDSEKREFQQFVQNESQKAGIQESASILMPHPPNPTYHHHSPYCPKLATHIAPTIS